MGKTLLVIGATGSLGEPVARQLKEDAMQVRVMTRDKDKAKKLYDEAFEIVVGDAMDTNSLGKALKGCFGVHISIGPPEIEPVVAEKVTSISSREVLQRISYISDTNTLEENAWFLPMTKHKLLAEKAIRESGIPFTIFCPCPTMAYLSECIRDSKATIIGKHSNPYHWLAPEDLAKMVSVSYRNQEAVNKKFFIHGPEAISFHEALRRYCSVFHPEIKKVSTVPHWLVNLIGTVTRNKKMKLASAFLAFYEKVGEGGDPAEANRILGAPKITLDEWLRQKKS